MFTISSESTQVSVMCPCVLPVTPPPPPGGTFRMSTLRTSRCPGCRSLKSRVKVLVDGTLLIPNLIPEDAGNYTCVPTNGILTPPSASASLTVKRKRSRPQTRVSVCPLSRALPLCPLRPGSRGPNAPGDVFARGDGGGDRLSCPGRPPRSLCELDQRWKRPESR